MTIRGIFKFFPLKHRTQVPTYLNKALKNLKRLFPGKSYFRFFRSDNGGEFIGEKTLEVLDKFDIQREPVEPFAHEHNGKIEWVHRTLEERIHALLFVSGFPNLYWELAAHCAMYIYNRTPHSALDYISPYKKVHSKKPDLSYLRFFGSRAYVYNDHVARGNKTASRSTTQYLVGFRNTGYTTIDLIKFARST